MIFVFITSSQSDLFNMYNIESLIIPALLIRISILLLKNIYAIEIASWQDVWFETSHWTARNSCLGYITFKSLIIISDNSLLERYVKQILYPLFDNS